ncbi:Uncharacterized protein dnm_071780 [Desulfonema magnum]|uniref:Uncharacterized protein n=1 Tax=Desulfonema magnum TaxID=45655 RepID=A0A975BTF7_9BACT|nr:Uncharacterized protein dnm_071780 [Desulfonema magnum]
MLFGAKNYGDCITEIFTTQKNEMQPEQNNYFLLSDPC